MGEGEKLFRLFNFCTLIQNYGQPASTWWTNCPPIYYVHSYFYFFLRSFQVA
jgi:hypothetical protein